MHADTLTIANKKLKKAVDTNNLSSVRIAQTIMEGASKLKDEETSLLKECSALEKRI